MKKQIILGLTLGTSLLLAPAVLASENSVSDAVDTSATVATLVNEEKSVEKEIAEGSEKSSDSVIEKTKTDVDTLTSKETAENKIAIVDTQATQETKELFSYLKELNTKKEILFGQQHALDEGVTLTEEGSRVASEQSDVKNAVGDYPAVFGWDTLSLDGHEKPGIAGDIQKSIQNLSESMKKAHDLGGILTLSTHPYNFVTGGNFNDTSGDVVSEILPGGTANEKFTAWLDNIATLAHSLKTADNQSIPFIFRPFHEQTGSWFWWGESTTNPEQYKALYRYTVEYLRDKKGVHNILYAYSPGAGNDRYLGTYPGDAYVDIFGIDSYDNKENAGSEAYISSLLKDLNKIVSLAESKGKIAALTEFGYSAQGLKEKGNTLDWYTRIFKAIKGDSEASKIAYMMTWANFNTVNNLYTPYKDINGNLGGNHELLKDFQDFYKDNHTLFRNEVGKIYGTNKTIPVNERTSQRYLIRPADHSLIESRKSTIVTKALSEDSRVTYVFAGEERELSKVGDYFQEELQISDSMDKKAHTLTLKYYNKDDLVETQSYTLFVNTKKVQPSPYLVDDFENYLGEDSLLEKAYSSNGDPISLSLQPAAEQGKYKMRYDYTIANNGYAGRQLSFDKNWEDRNALTFEMKTEAHPKQHLTVQVQIGGVSFEKDIDLSQAIDGKVTIPFSEFKPAGWESHQNAQITKERLKKVTQFAFYVGGEKGVGSIEFDTIQAIKDSQLPPVPDKESEKEYQPLTYTFEGDSLDWQGTDIQVKEKQLVAQLNAESGEKTEVKLTKGQDLSSYDWYVARVKTTVPVSAKLYLKVGDSWQWVNSEPQKVTDELIELRFDISGIKNRDSVKEIGIEFTGQSQQKQAGFASIELVTFVKNLSELTQEQKPTEDHDIPSPTENNQSNIGEGKENEENKVEKPDASISPLEIDNTQIKGKENSIETNDLNKSEQKRNLSNKVEKPDASISPLDVDKIQIKEKENSVETKDSNKPEQKINLPNTGEKKRDGLFELGSIFLIVLTFLVARMKRLTSGKM